MAACHHPLNTGNAASTAVAELVDSSVTSEGTADTDD
jgi:hypothetical protein